MFLIAAIDTVAAISIGCNVVLAILTGIYVWATHRLVKHQTEPKVIVYADRAENSRHMINTVIENVGGGMATDIRFKVEGELPRQKMAHIMQPEFENMATGPLFDGIPALAPGARRFIYWGDAWGLFKVFQGKRTDVSCFFRISGRSDDILREEQSTLNVLEVDSLALEEQPYNHSWSENYLRDIATNTRSIAQEASACKSALSRLR